MRPLLNNTRAIRHIRSYTYKTEPSKYPGHVPTNCLQKLFLAAGSGIYSFFNPRRGDLIATLGEATALPPLMYRLRDVMLSDPTGRRILRERPRITSKTLDIAALRKYPANTVGKVYSEWLDLEGVSPDTRAPVRYIDDAECAYVMQRYRECHDFYHAITGLPIIIEGEIALKMFEFANTLIPMTGIGAVLAPLRLKPKQRERLRTIYFPWAIKNGATAKPLINVYWEEVLDRDVQELRDELGIEKPPDLRQLRKLKISHL
ncbi:ubiquinone biosynthesis protein coq4, mitochondrial [Myxozyma melibiosi]|uniref:4-hydroxy-3-methoxy-5-polyprenylbenzoate decarboxylase n=1 Tax=Myxozyma melibiosi TaxID=54550 RepID=A0ABR1FCN7_9ASCO